MGARPVNPDKYYEAEDTFESDETSETLKWHAATQYSTSNTPSGDYNDSYYYFLRYADSSTTTPTITYFLRQSVDKIYNYRKFYFIVPIGCNLSFGIEALDFLAYNG